MFLWSSRCLACLVLAYRSLPLRNVPLWETFAVNLIRSKVLLFFCSHFTLLFIQRPSFIFAYTYLTSASNSSWFADSMCFIFKFRTDWPHASQCIFTALSLAQLRQCKWILRSAFKNIIIEVNLLGQKSLIFIIYCYNIYRYYTLVILLFSIYYA